jgi:hypothetical protein
MEFGVVYEGLGVGVERGSYMGDYQLGNPGLGGDSCGFPGGGMASVGGRLLVCVGGKGFVDK